MTSSEHRPRILGVGIACLDYLFLAPRAASGGQAPLRDHLIQGGGLVGTAVVAAARLGAAADIWTWVGDDPEGQQVLAELQQEGVGIGLAELITGARTALSFIHVEADTGERTIFHGPRVQVPQSLLAGVAKRTLACDVLLVDAVWPEASQAAAAMARRDGRPVVGDFCPSAELSELASLVTALIVPGKAADRLLPDVGREEQLRSFARSGPAFVAITSGSEGCHYLEGGRVRHRPAFSVPVVDTTGAGDVFHGAFAYALAHTWPASQAVEFAAAAAALSCRALGGRTSAPTSNEVLALLKAQGPGGW